MIVRAIIDHIPPVFGKSNFAEVCGGYGTKSFRDSMNNLDKSSRKIADAYLHTPIRAKEVLPNRTQVNFKHDLDVLLQEIERVNKKMTSPNTGLATMLAEEYILVKISLISCGPG